MTVLLFQSRKFIDKIAFLFRYLKQDPFHLYRNKHLLGIQNNKINDGNIRDVAETLLIITAGTFIGL